MHRGFAVLLGLADASAFSKEVLTQLSAQCTFFTKSVFDMFSFIQSTFSDMEAFCTKERRTLWNPINARVALVEKGNIDGGIVR